MEQAKQRGWMAIAGTGLWVGPVVTSLGFNLGTALAHQVQRTTDVAGTLHIEPNDVPRAAEPTQVWIALTRRGGAVVPLADCRCQLGLYADPYQPGDDPLQMPPLEPVSAEGYAQIPGAEVVFPAVGTYTLVLTGKPGADTEFTPFEFTFPVTVAAGAVAETVPETVPEATPEATPAAPAPAPEATVAVNTTPADELAPTTSLLGLGLAVGGLGLLGLGWWLGRRY